MKSIMYHYVRNKSKLFPNYNILEKKIFVNQIKKFSKSGLISLYEELFIPSDKFLATFDDGFKDHIFAAAKIWSLKPSSNVAKNLSDGINSSSYKLIKPDFENFFI